MITANAISTDSASNSTGITSKGKKGKSNKSLFSKLLASLQHGAKTGQTTNHQQTKTTGKHDQEGASQTTSKLTSIKAGKKDLITPQQSTVKGLSTSKKDLITPQQSTVKGLSTSKKDIAALDSTNRIEADAKDMIATTQEVQIKPNIMQPNQTAHTDKSLTDKTKTPAQPLLLTKQATQEAVDSTSGDTKPTLAKAGSVIPENTTILPPTQENTSKRQEPEIPFLSSSRLSQTERMNKQHPVNSNPNTKEVLASASEQNREQASIIQFKTSNPTGTLETDTLTKKTDKNDTNQTLTDRSGSRLPKELPQQPTAQQSIDKNHEPTEQARIPVVTVQQRGSTQAQNVQANALTTNSNNSIGSMEQQSSSSQQDLPSNQQGMEQSLLDASKTEQKTNKNLDFQAQLAYRSQRAFTPADTMLEIVKSAKDGSTSLELQLEPANLGKVQVSIQMDAAKQIQVSFTVDQNASKQALEQQMPQLRIALAQQGLDLGGFSMQMNQQHSQQEHASSNQQSRHDHDSTMTNTTQELQQHTRMGINLAVDGRLSILA